MVVWGFTPHGGLFVLRGGIGGAGCATGGNTKPSPSAVFSTIGGAFCPQQWGFFLCTKFCPNYWQNLRILPYPARSNGRLCQGKLGRAQALNLTTGQYHFLQYLGGAPDDEPRVTLHAFVKGQATDFMYCMVSIADPEQFVIVSTQQPGVKEETLHHHKAFLYEHTALLDRSPQTTNKPAMNKGHHQKEGWA